MHTGDPFGWVGSIIDGQFAVEAPAGEGAFGIVYRGRHLGFDVPIAIKCLKIPADLNAEGREDFLAKFREEARLLHRLSRRTMGIVQALDIGAAAAPSGQWAPYIVMEWLEGETLEQDLKRRRAEGRLPRTLDEAMRMLAPVAAALSIAHDEHVSHRDVKPANLFLARGRDAERIKVLDFGLAKVFAETPTVTEALAQTGRAFRAFTPQYGAPEQFSPRYGATGPWTDVYAMALILVELTLGRPALVGNDVIQLFVASSDEAHRPTPRALGVPVSPAVEAVLARALAVNPAVRHASAGEMWSALEAARRASIPEVRRDTLRVPALPAALVARRSQTPVPRDPGVVSSGPGRTSAPAAPPTPPPASPVRSSRSQSLDLRSGTESPLVGPEAGENRVCTVLFADLSDAAGPTSRLDPEEVKELLDGAFRLLADQVERMGGFVEKPVGGRVMAVFGVPRSTDHDAERAAAAALGIRAALEHMPGPRGARVARPAPRIGVATGRVFVGPSSPGGPGAASADAASGRGGSGFGGARPELAVFGEAVTAAARMQQVAPRGAIVIDRDTHRLLRGRFELELLALEPGLVAYRVLGEGAFPQAIARADFHGLETRLVGRGAEIGRLVGAVDAAIARRQPRLITVVGPPGVGRTRLLAELGAALLARGGLVVMEAQCAPLSREASYGLVASLLRRRFSIHQADPPAVVRHKLRRGVRWLRARTARPPVDPAEPPCTASPLELSATARAPVNEALGLRELGEVLGRVAVILGAQPAPDLTLDVAGRAEATPDAKARILGAVFRLAAFALERTPMVILCDDAQWADDASLDLLDDLVARAEGLPLAVVCAAQPEIHERRPHWGRGRALDERIEVPPLGRLQVEEMIHDRLRRMRDPAPDLVTLLADRAEGNPRTLEEMLQLLIDAGAIDTSGEPWEVREAELGALSLPPTVQGLVQARLDRLDPEARGVLALASVVGRTFWEGAVDRLRQATPQGRSSRTSEPALQLDDLDPPFSSPEEDVSARMARGSGPTPTSELLARLCERQIIQPRAPAMLADEREYVFAEGLICDVAYEMLSVKVRRRIHLLVADWLEPRAIGDAGAALLAVHHDRGGALRDAAAAYARAASHALMVGEIIEALRHLQRVREIHDEASEGDEGGARPAWAPEPEPGDGAPLGGTQRSPSWEGVDRRVAPWRDRVRLRLELGDLLRQTGDLEGAVRAYEEARARVLRAELRFGPSVDPRDRLRWDSRIDLRMALVHQARGAVREALEMARRASERAAQGGAGGEVETARALIEYLEASDSGPTMSGG